MGVLTIEEQWDWGKRGSLLGRTTRLLSVKALNRIYLSKKLGQVTKEVFQVSNDVKRDKTIELCHSKDLIIRVNYIISSLMD